MPVRSATASAGRRTQAERREQSGKSLVEAVVDVVSQRGVSAATFEAIGARAGYSRSLVTQRFGSKQGLIDAVIEHAAGSFESLQASRNIGALSGLDSLLSLLDLYLTELATSAELRTYFMLLSSAVAEVSELRAAFAGEHQRVKGRLAALVAKGQSDGSIRYGIDPESAALMIGSLQLGLSVQLLVDPTTNLAPIRQVALDTVRLSFAAAP